MEDLTVKPSATTSTSVSTSTPSLTATSSGSSSFGTKTNSSYLITMEESVEATLSSTPRNHQPIQSYEDIGISPDSLKPLDEAEKKMSEDGILEEKFEDRNALVFRCIYFLYGRGYAWEEDRDDRIEKIRRIVECPQARERLRYIACPCAGHETMLNDRAVEMYCRVGLTAQKVLGKGGFPREPIVRIQRWANCYSPAGCVWATLQWQVDMPGNSEAHKPLDVAQLGRRFGLGTTDAELESRVLDNRGMPVLEFASKIVGRKSNCEGWDEIDFENQETEFLLHNARRVAERVEILDQFGLVSNFRVHQGFRDAAGEEEENFVSAMKEVEETSKKTSKLGIPFWKRGRKNKQGKKTVALNVRPIALGYRKFDGYDVDTKGEAVSVRYDKNLNGKQMELRKIWKTQAKDFEKKNDERKETTVDRVPEGWETTTAKATPAKSTDQSLVGDGDGSGKHAMVLLGTHREYKRDALTGKRREHIYFMLLNSWRYMPLVLVSPEYLWACNAKVYFLKNKLGDPPASLERDYRVWGESSYFDGGDDPDAASEPFLTIEDE